MDKESGEEASDRYTRAVGIAGRSWKRGAGDSIPGCAAEPNADGRRERPHSGHVPGHLDFVGTTIHPAPYSGPTLHTRLPQPPIALFTIPNLHHKSPFPHNSPEDCTRLAPGVLFNPTSRNFHSELFPSRLFPNKLKSSRLFPSKLLLSEQFPGNPSRKGSFPDWWSRSW